MAKAQKCSHPAGAGRRPGFILTFEAVFALSVLFLAGYIIYYYIQLAQADTFSGIRLSKYSMDFLSVHDKLGTLLYSQVSTIITYNTLPGNYTRVTNITTVSSRVSQPRVESALGLIPSRYCAKFEFELDNSSSLFSPVYKSGCALTGGDYAVSRRVLVLTNVTYNTTYYYNITHTDINRTTTSSASYSYGIAALTMWYRDSVHE
ncbi:MAG: hypothetical protein WC506_03530 [Candidatus Micrarchaeia archaeon]